MITKLRSFGFEIEGEFSEDFSRKLSSLGVMKSDGSVHRCYQNPSAYGKCINENDDLDAAEFNSKVFPFSSLGIRGAKRILNEFDVAYMSKEYHWNSSAGLHVHVGFDPKFPPEIFSAQFRDYFLRKFAALFPKEYKMRKNAKYCLAKIELEEIAGREAPRYRAINFWSAMRTHGTVEFRIFPTNEPLKMLQYIMFAISTTDSFLKTYKLDESTDVYIGSSPKEERLMISSMSESEGETVSIDAFSRAENDFLSVKKSLKPKKQKVEIESHSLTVKV